jgi:hypothetical protein
MTNKNRIPPHCSNDSLLHDLKCMRLLDEPFFSRNSVRAIRILMWFSCTVFRVATSSTMDILRQACREKLEMSVQTSHTSSFCCMYMRVQPEALTTKLYPRRPIKGTRQHLFLAFEVLVAASRLRLTHRILLNSSSDLDCFLHLWIHTKTCIYYGLDLFLYVSSHQKLACTIGESYPFLAART